MEKVDIQGGQQASIQQDIQHLRQLRKQTQDDEQKRAYASMIRSLQEMESRLVASIPFPQKEKKREEERERIHQLVEVSRNKAYFRKKKKRPILTYSWLKKIPDLQIALYQSKVTYVSRRARENPEAIEFMNCQTNEVITLASIYYRIRNVRTERNDVLAKRKQTDQELEIQTGKYDLLVAMTQKNK
ncbi:hypothetical protein ACYRFS_12905 [Listeria kieliensis]